MSRSVFSHRRHFPVQGPLLSTDSFNRLVTMGSTDGAGSLDPVAWTLNTTGGSAWVITANTAGTTLDANGCTADIASGFADILVSATFGTTADGGLLLRASGATPYSNCWIVRPNQAGTPKVELIRRIGGAGVSVKTGATTFVAGDRVSALAWSSTIWVLLNGKIVICASAPSNQTATRHGLYTAKSTQSLDDFALYRAL